MEILHEEKFAGSNEISMFRHFPMVKDRITHEIHPVCDWKKKWARRGAAKIRISLAGDSDLAFTAGIRYL
jgi:hypothetical protein